MRCSQFREHYSDFRDGRIPGEHFRAEMQAHVQSCEACTRFHETLEQGVSLIYRSGEILVPPGFKKRIMRGVEKSRQAESVTPAPAGLAAALMVAAAIALVVFRPATETPPAVASQPAQQVLFPQFEAPPTTPHVDYVEFGLRRTVPAPTLMAMPGDSAGTPDGQIDGTQPAEEGPRPPQ